MLSMLDYYAKNFEEYQGRSVLKGQADIAAPKDYPALPDEVPRPGLGGIADIYGVGAADTTALKPLPAMAELNKPFSEGATPNYTSPGFPDYSSSVQQPALSAIGYTPPIESPGFDMPTDYGSSSPPQLTMPPGMSAGTGSSPSLLDALRDQFLTPGYGIQAAKTVSQATSPDYRGERPGYSYVLGSGYVPTYGSYEGQVTGAGEMYGVESYLPPEETLLGDASQYLGQAAGYAGDVLKAINFYQTVQDQGLGPAVGGAAQGAVQPAIKAGAAALSAYGATEAGAATAASTVGSAISSAIPVIQIVAAVDAGRQRYGNIDEPWDERSANQKWFASPGAQSGTGHLGDFASRNAPDSPIAQAYDWMGKMEEKFVGEPLDLIFNQSGNFVSNIFRGPGNSGNPATPIGQAWNSIPTLEEAKQGFTGMTGGFGTWNVASPDFMYLKEHPDKVPEEVWNMNINQYINWFRGQVQSNPEVKQFYQDVRQYTDPYMANVSLTQEGWMTPVTTFGAYDEWVGGYQPPAPPPPPAITREQWEQAMSHWGVDYGAP